MKMNIKKLTTASILIALTVALSTTFYIPIGASKCFPIQHMVNVIAAVFLGPTYGVLMAFCSSLLRNLLGTGSLLAFPGSMIGAFLAGYFYKKFSKLMLAYMGEIIGTGIIGAILSYPIAIFLMGKEAALFTFIIPFLMSSAVGTAISMVLIRALDKTKAMSHLKKILEGEM